MPPCYTKLFTSQTYEQAKPEAQTLKANTPRQKAIHKAVREILPLVPYSDFTAVVSAARSKHMKDLLPTNAAFLSAVAHIRHQYTDYDELLEEGYDQDSARFFVASAIDEQLAEWGCKRGLEAIDPLDDLKE